MTIQEQNQLTTDASNLCQKLYQSNPQDANIIKNLLSAYINAESVVEAFVSYTVLQEGDEETAYEVIRDDVGIDPEDFERYL